MDFALILNPALQSPAFALALSETFRACALTAFSVSVNVGCERLLNINQRLKKLNRFSASLIPYLRPSCTATSYVSPKSCVLAGTPSSRHSASVNSSTPFSFNMAVKNSNGTKYSRWLVPILMKFTSIALPKKAAAFFFALMSVLEYDFIIDHSSTSFSTPIIFSPTFFALNSVSLIMDRPSKHAPIKYPPTRNVSSIFFKKPLNFSAVSKK